MKIYLAGRYTSVPEMRERRAQLARLGHTVTSQWIDHHGSVPFPLTPETLGAAAGVADTAWSDVADADTVISFTASGTGKGGRHVEFGMGIALGKRSIVIGEREHVFHALPAVELYSTWEEFLACLQGEA
jgi:hypothetical protein